jgi:hypothetical protein
LGKNNGIPLIPYREITLSDQEKYPLALGYYPASSHNIILSFGFPGCGALIDQRPDSLIYS